ncbi:MAG: type II toxin-antitoxin system RelE/ParE family toxin [Dehalococcoidia bacterium]|nr:type II toxin-antitoxin system RelE/ParE family toxin [Dehalococcoidia bacterium]
MARYALELKPRAKRELDRIKGQDYQRISVAIDDLRDDPRPRGMRKLSGNYDPPLWRIRVGNHRIIYSIDDNQSKITIARVARRAEDTYKEL